MRVVTVVVTYNRKNLLVETIDSLLQQGHELVQIVIINNASTDGTFELLASKRYLDNPKIKYIQMEENLGGAGGFSYGMKYAFNNTDFDYLWVMDDDAEPEPDCLKKLIEKIKRFGFDGGGSVVIRPDQSIDYEHRGAIKINKFGVTHEPHIMVKTDSSFIPVDFVSFVGALYSRELIDSVGFPNEKFFIHHDDFEYSIRIKEKGFRLLLDYESSIMHKQVSHNLKRQKFFFFEMDAPVDNNKLWLKLYSPRNLAYLNSKYASLFASILFSSKIMIKECIRLVYHPKSFSYQIKCFAKALLSGISKKVE